LNKSVQQNACCPDIHRILVASFENFGSSVEKRASNGPHIDLSVFSPKPPGDAEVDQLHNIVFDIIKDVFRLYISMHNLFFVQKA
jgi:hypothetical protein